MGSFLSSILTGSNPTLSGDIGNAGQINGFGTAVGEGDINAASGFDEDLLSGNPTKIAKLLAPQISNIAKQAQQKIQTNAQFNNRSGGTNASNQTTGDAARAAVNDMIAKLTGKAAGDIGTLGENVLNTGLNANEVQAKEAEEQEQNFAKSILGQGLGEGLGFLEGKGLTKLFPGPKS